MPGFITLRRSTASVKLLAAVRCTYYFERKGGARYEREVPVETMAAAFAANSRMKLRIRLSDDAHFVQLVENSRESHGYRVDFN